MIDPAVADLTCEYLSSKSIKLWILRSRSHVLKVVELTIVRYKLRIERFKQNPTGNLRGDQIGKPSCSAPGSTRHQNTPANIWIRIEKEMTANELNGSSIKFSGPKSDLFQTLTYNQHERKD